MVRATQATRAVHADPIAVYIIEGAIRGTAPSFPVEDAGAVICFEGVVRPVESGRAIAALDYEAYQPMADNEMRRLAEDVLRRHGLTGVCVEHSRGRVAAGACSFRLRVSAGHRPEALRAVGEFIDRMKRDVPIWKTPVYAD